MGTLGLQESLIDSNYDKVMVLTSEDGYRSLVARERISQGNTILYLPSISLPHPDKYSIEVHPGLHIDCSSSVAGAINHACDPNSAVRGMRIMTWWRCVEEGEEVTIDYRVTEKRLSNPFKCNCCRKQIGW